ncbi:MULTISPECIES: mechanosensitive ion channel family protein [Pseudoalteromonas]|uniref:Transporter n=1 Tax=Pseudoalteromonas ruthenica TaxID=151081 RepID=A0A0F4PPC0_9GAMM|nr:MULTISPECIES: mechanosensitive ion channel domain-containing protein [Pseudoalteromonas]KJY95422.1 transporter [Pseudoalteromonas ruthenica]KJY96964.1 transporter [Pseudoalteromonas ruthenica]MCG7545233.1 mechanosensitive ion channel family protein [Pseudoalteromonas sp. MM17-2]MCG7568083.1 mechanosensitive ion channel family protein [Pseudoalteromonas sp. CnMc7-15]MCG7571734.1 mechanosensitive ion channel family protein [Pseudoalteromonas sp. CNC9-20]
MNESQLQTLVEPWFEGMEQASLFSAITATGLGMLAILLLYFFLRSLMLPGVQSLAAKLSPERITMLAPLLQKLNRRVAGIICCVVFLAFFQNVFPSTELVGGVVRTLAQIALIVYGGFIVSSVVSVGGAIYNQFEFAREVPIQGLIQLVKLVTFIICAILIFSLLLEKSPTYIISGFGAIAAVTMLVFKDTILGFVASIQIAANRLVTYGDWIQVDNYGADGEVIDLGLNTVKVRNWDNTITTIPTYMLVAGSFKNWRGMQESGGRRIKRSLNIDMNSIRLADEALQQRISDSINIDDYVKASNLPEQVTNLGLFRRYAEGYLKQHERINNELTLMVREMQPLNHGLPIEFYCFSADKRWISYEHLQAEIMDHLLAMLPVFELRPYQSITGQMSSPN